MPRKLKNKSLEQTIQSIKNKFGEEAIMTLEEQPDVDVDAIPTGSMGLNYALGIGGLPRGRVVEIYGAESSGKTTQALHVVAETQKMGGTCAFIDAENALDPQYARQIGVVTKDLLISQPNSGDEALQLLQAIVEGGGVDVVVVDSVAALTPKSEIEGELGEFKVGAQARLMSQSLRVLSGAIAKANMLVIFINQLRTNIGAWTPTGQVPETTAGGRALKYYASIRIEMKRLSQIKKAEEVIGSRVRCKVVKNKVAPPFRIAEYDILYNEGISHEGELLLLGEKYKLIRKTGAMYAYENETLGRGYDAARKKLTQENDMARCIKDEILVHIQS